MMYVLVQLADYANGECVDTPLRIASSSSTLLSWFKENYPEYSKLYDSELCSEGIRWTGFAKVDGHSREFACFEVEKI